MPTLIVEDGSQVANANAYQSLAGYETFLSDHGLTDSRADAAKEAALISATEYVENQEARFKGWKSSSTQALVFPRAGLSLHGYAVATNSIPSQVVKAVSQLAYDSSSYSLYKVGKGQGVLKKKVDVLEVQYASSASASVQNVFTQAMQFLQPLFVSRFGIRV